MTHKKTWGLVLSGGTACGLANIGILEILEQQNLKPDYIAGSSMGAVIGALFALGYDTRFMKDLIANINPLTIATISKEPLKNGLQGGFLRQNLETILTEYVGEKRIRDCAIPFVCIAGRIRKPLEWTKILQKDFTKNARKQVEKYVFPPETRIMDAILASTAVPILFSPVTIGTDQFADLIMFGAIPARTLQEIYKPDILIATDTNESLAAWKKFLPRGGAAFFREGEAELKHSKDVCDLVIKPDLPYSQFRFDKAEAFIESGRKAGEKALPILKELIGR